jgi:type I restriction enzyme S subunit
LGDLGEQPLTSEIYPLEWYRETPLGPLPEEWKTVQIEDIAEVKGGKRLPKGHKFSDQPTPYPYIRVVDFKNNSIDLSNLRFLHSEDRKAIQRYTISCKDLYISIAGTIGLVGLVPQKIDGANLTENAAKIVIKDEKRVDQRYLVYFLASHIGQTEISQRTTKTSQPKLALTRIKQIPVILPPLLEQQGIAHVLSTVQKAIQTSEKVIEASRELKRSLMNHLFTYGPVPVDEAEQVKLQSTEMGLIPKEWLLCTLEDLKASEKRAIVSGPFGSNIGKRFFVEKGVPLIRGNNLTKGKVQFVEEGFVFVTEEKAQELSGCTALPSDLVFTAAGTIGQVGIIPNKPLYEKYIISNKQLRARVDRSRVLPMFLFYWFAHNRMQDFIAGQRRGSSIPVINLGILRKLPVGLPDLTTQERIVHDLLATDYKIASEENRLESSKLLFKTLLHNLMTGKVRVKDLDLSTVKEMM